MIVLGRWKHAALALVPFLMGTAQPQEPPRYDRARAEANYAAIMRGEKTLSDLGPLEQQEVVALDRLARAEDRTPRLSAEQKCRLAEIPEGRTPTELELRATDLKCSGR